MQAGGAPLPLPKELTTAARWDASSALPLLNGV